MSTPATSSAPDGPTQSSPLRSGGQFRTWFTNITDWIRGLSPSGLPHTTNWITGVVKASRVVELEPTWEITDFACSREGRDVDMQMRIVYKGQDVPVPEHGDVINVPMGMVDVDFRPRYMAALSAGESGPLASVSIDRNGYMYLCAVTPATTITAERVFSFQGMWRMAGTDTA